MTGGTAQDCEVLVVGAGPTGLMAATLLARSGVSVMLVEKRAEATRESRAFAVQARTLELMRTLGLADRFIANGVRADSVNIHVQGRFRGGLDFARARADDTPFPFILMIPQSRTEAILAEDCAANGVAIARGNEVLGIVEADDGIVATVRDADGAERTIRAAYVVGGDGSRSIVRQAAGLGWTGDMFPQRFLLADCKVDWPLDHDRFRVFMNGPLIGLFLPLDGEKLSRVMATDMSGAAGFGSEDASTAAPLDLAEMQRGLEAAIALPVRLSDPVWVTRYRAHHRHVDRYAKGRCFVAGDAAHIHSPAGGQGMNTGLQDAANLAWKLAAVLRHGADPALLDSYDAERRPVGEQVVRSTGKLFAAAAGQSGVKARMRDALVSFVLPLLTRLPPFQRKAFLNSSQRAIAYPASDWVRGDAGAVAPGMRVPDAPVAGGTIHGHIACYRFHLLLLARAPLAAPEWDDPRCPMSLVTDAPAETWARFGVPEGGAATLLVRPDGHVAWRADRIAVDETRAALARFGTAAVEGGAHDLAA